MGTTIYSSCPFCGENRKAFLKNYGYDVNSMYFYEDDEFSISPDLSPLVTGHLLAIPRQHYASFGSLMDSHLLDKIILVGTNLLATDDVLIFEHGAVIDGEGGSSIDHAHLHIMPKPLNLNARTVDKYVKESGYVDSPKEICSQELLHTWYMNRQPYIFYRLKDEWFAYPVNNLPHQFLRIMLQPYCQLSYNWRETFTTDECKHNVENTISLIKKNQILK